VLFATKGVVDCPFSPLIGHRSTESKLLQMEYSDDEERVSLDHHSEATSSSDGSMDDALDRLEEDASRLHREYAEMFEFEDSDFQLHFEGPYLEHDVLLDEDTAAPATRETTASRWKDVALWLAADVASRKAEDCPVGGDTPDRETPALPVRPPMPPGTSHVATVSSSDGQLWKLMESPATKRLKAEPPLPTYEGVLFPIDAAINRKDLQASIRDNPALSLLVDGDDVFVGYHFRDSAGLALALFLSNDQDTCSARMTAFGHALAQDGIESRLLRKDQFEDLRPFYRVDRIKGHTAATSASDSHDVSGASYQTVAPKPKASLSHAMRDATRLKEVIAVNGGLIGCRFVAFDSEAAVVVKGSVPLPLELAFVDCHDVCPSEVPCPRVMHVDPGLMDDDDLPTAIMLSLCCVPGGHGMPFRRCSFLSNRYQQMSDSIHALLFPKTSGASQTSSEAKARDDAAATSPPPLPRRVILINKGSTMDIHAIRWIYAADALQTGAAPDDAVPMPLEIPMFDVTCLQEVLGVDLTRDVHHRYGEQSSSLKDCIAAAKDDVGRCWYHGDPFVKKVFAGAHCAARDARALAAVVGRWLENCGH
jgi:hypothetical protein